MEILLASPQDKLKAMLSKYLSEKYPEVIETDEYIIAEGTIPIALCAHMDTVFETEIRSRGFHNELMYDKERNTMHCLGYGGFDDKAGVFAILQILQAGFRPHIIFSTDEERGCIGASALAHENCPFKDCRYIIQLDRRGTRDCVFYDMDTTLCKDFVSYVEGFGFTEAYGTFTDITEYCPSWGIAGVNLSIGYFNEHTHSEILYVDPMLATITKVKAMLSQTEIPEFVYIETDYGRYNWKHLYGWDDNYCSYGYTNKTLPSKTSKNQTYTCAGCKKNNFLEAEIFPVVSKSGKTKYFCGDCLIGRVNWCTKCWEAYEIDPETETEDPSYVCEFCRKQWSGANDKGAKKQ